MSHHLVTGHPVHDERTVDPEVERDIVPIDRQAAVGPSVVDVDAGDHRRTTPPAGRQASWQRWRPWPLHRSPARSATRVFL